MYLPALTNARPVSRYMIGEYLAVVLTDCESKGSIEYKHVVLVYRMGAEYEDGENPLPVLAVAAEKSEGVAELLGEESTEERYFLGVFPGDGHMNMGMSADWADLEKFTTKALDVIANHFKIDKPPFLVPNQVDDSPKD